MLRIVKENYGLVECIMISAINEVETAVQAMKHGAYHYITKNFEYDELRSLVRNACERQDLNRQVITLSAQVTEQREREFHIGPSKQIRDIVDLVQKVAKLSATVLILGESGTGKELLARVLHRDPAAASRSFIAVNLSAIPNELVEALCSGGGHERGACTGAHKQQLGKSSFRGGHAVPDEIGTCGRPAGQALRAFRRETSSGVAAQTDSDGLPARRSPRTSTSRKRGGRAIPR